MPDAYGNVKGISVPAAAWDRIFGREAKLRSITDCPAGHGPRAWMPQSDLYLCETCAHVISGREVYGRLRRSA